MDLLLQLCHRQVLQTDAPLQLLHLGARGPCEGVGLLGRQQAGPWASIQRASEATFVGRFLRQCPTPTSPPASGSTAAPRGPRGFTGLSWSQVSSVLTRCPTPPMPKVKSSVQETRSQRPQQPRGPFPAATSTPSGQRDKAALEQPLRRPHEAHQVSRAHEQRRQKQKERCARKQGAVLEIPAQAP